MVKRIEGLFVMGKEVSGCVLNKHQITIIYVSIDQNRGQWVCMALVI